MTKDHGQISYNENFHFSRVCHCGVLLFVRIFQRYFRIFHQYLDDYNMSSSHEMRLVFFLDAIEHPTEGPSDIGGPYTNVAGDED